MAFTCNIFLNSQLGAACKINSNAIAMTDKLCRKIVSKLSCMNDSTVKKCWGMLRKMFNIKITTFVS